MCSWVNTISPEKTIAEAVKLMVEKRTNSLIVVDESKKPIGLVSSHSLIRAVVPEYLRENEITSQFNAEGAFDKHAQRNKDMIVKDVMYEDIHILNVNDAMIEAATYASKGARRVLPVADERGTLVGAITRTCIKLALYNAIFKDNQIDPGLMRRNGGKEDCGCGCS